MNLPSRASACLLFATGITLAQDSTTLPAFIHMQRTDVRFEPLPDNPALSAAILSGDPQAPGIYVMRVRFAPGVTSPPHYHDQDRHVTVISGVWAFGTGESGDCADTIPLREGAYAMHPRGAVHFDGSCGEDPVEVQIIGNGPVRTHWLSAGQ